MGNLSFQTKKLASRRARPRYKTPGGLEQDGCRGWKRMLYALHTWRCARRRRRHLRSKTKHAKRHRMKGSKTLGSLVLRDGGRRLLCLKLAWEKDGQHLLNMHEPKEISDVRRKCRHFPRRNAPFTIFKRGPPLHLIVSCRLR